MFRSNRRSCRSGFTLVELLVVVGIVVLLIAILLPVLGNAREASRTAKCLSNLRQIGLGIQMYADAHRGLIVPCGYYGTMDGFGKPGGAHWAGILTHGGFVPGGDGMSASENVFRCPSGLEDFRGGLITAPTSTTDSQGAHSSVRFDETTGELIRTWYAVNCTPGAPLGLQPFRQLPGLGIDGGEDYQLNKLNRCRNASRLVMVFDGFIMLWQFDPRFINARHKNRTVTNLLMADGHAESQPTVGLVGAGGVSVSNRLVHWPLDQSWASFR